MRSKQTTPVITPATPVSTPPGIKTRSYFSRQSLILTAAALCFLVVFSQAGQYGAWTQKLLIFWRAFLIQKESLSEKDRLAGFYGDGYTEAMYIKKNLDKSRFPNPVLLFQPPGYFTSNKIDFAPPESAAFYFMTGYVSLPFNALDAKRATHFVEIDKYQMKMSRIKSPEQFNQIRQRYQQYQ